MVIEDKILKCAIPHTPIPNVAFPDFILQQVKSFSEEKAGQVWLNDWSTRKKIRYCEIAPTVARLNAGMQKRGFQPGTVICMYASNHVEFPLITLAAWQLKGITTGLNTSTPPNEVAERCNVCEARIICCDRNRAANALKAMEMSTKVQEIWVIDGEYEGCVPMAQLLCDISEVPNESANMDRKHNPDDVIWVPFSSGTTGLPKGIMHTHNTLLSMVTVGSARAYPNFPNGAQLIINGMAHILALVATFRDMIRTNRVIILSDFSEISFVKAIADTKPDAVTAYPTQMAWLLRHAEVREFDLSSVEVFSIAGTTWNMGDEAAIFHIFPNLKIFNTGYGMTEVGLVSSAYMRATTSERGIQVCYERKPCSSGWLLPGISLKVLDQVTGERLGAGEQGAVWVQTPTLMKGYLCNPKASEEFFKDGWAFTGDIGYYDEDEQLFITGRSKDLIKYRAYHVVPTRIESMLCSLEDIADACLVGIPHEIDGQRPAAAVVLKLDAKLSADDIQDYVNQRVSDEANLRGGVYFLKQIPYNGNGKILRGQVLEEVISQRN